MGKTIATYETTAAQTNCNGRVTLDRALEKTHEV